MHIFGAARRRWSFLDFFAVVRDFDGTLAGGTERHGMREKVNS